MPRRRVEKRRVAGGARRRCEVCRQFAAQCICARLPQASPGIRVVVVQHALERKNPSNTGCLVHHVLRGSVLVRHGAPGQLLEASVLEDPGTDRFVLYPHPKCPVIPEGVPPAGPGRTRALVVLDATWSQARKMAQRIPEVRKLPFARLPDGASPRFALRKPPRPGRLGTAEAVALALDLLGESEAARKLEEALALVGEAALRERGKVRSRNLSGPDRPSS